MRQTPLAVGSRSRSSTGRWNSGALRRLQRQLFNVDGMGLPHEAVLAQIDLLGEKVVPCSARSSPRSDRRTSRTRHATSR